MFILGQHIPDETWKTDRKIGATEALSRLREKVAEQRELIEVPDLGKSESWSCQDFVEAGHAEALDDVLAPIDEEMRDGQA